MIHRFLRTYVVPPYDPDGNTIRIAVITLTLIMLYLSVALINNDARLDELSILESILFFLIPMWGAGYAIVKLRAKRPSENREQHARVSWRDFLPRNIYYRVIFSFALGLLSWGIGNLYWLALQGLVMKTFFESPPVWYFYDAFYTMLQVGFLLGMVGLYRAQSLSLSTMFWANRWTTALWVLANTVLGIVLALMGRGWRLSHSEDPLMFGLQVFWAVLDGLVLASLYLYTRTLDVTKWSRAFRLGLTIMKIGWAVFVIADQLFEFGESVALDSPYHYYDVSFYDFFFLAAIVLMIHGMIFVVYAVLGEHPHIVFLSEEQRELMRRLVARYSVKELARQYGRTEPTVERWLTALYEATGFGGADRTSKRKDFIMDGKN